MRIINRKYGYLFNCSIHGKIIVSQKEWRKITTYLLHPRTSFDDSYYNTFYKKMLREDLKRGIQTKEGTLISIRVHCTQKVIERFDSTGMKYKRNNYMFLVTNK